MELSFFPKYCKRCGKPLQISENEIKNFCAACGTKIDYNYSAPNLQVRRRYKELDEAQIREQSYRDALEKNNREKLKQESDTWNRIIRSTVVVCTIFILFIILLFILKQPSIAICFIALTIIIFSTLWVAYDTYSILKNPYTEYSVNNDSLLFGALKTHVVNSITPWHRLLKRWMYFAGFVFAIYAITSITILIIKWHQ